MQGVAIRAGQTAFCLACQRVPSYAQVRPIPRGGSYESENSPVSRCKTGEQGFSFDARVQHRVHGRFRYAGGIERYRAVLAR